jgi:hypothetical protein
VKASLLLEAVGLAETNGFLCFAFPSRRDMYMNRSALFTCLAERSRELCWMTHVDCFSRMEEWFPADTRRTGKSNQKTASSSVQR